MSSSDVVRYSINADKEFDKELRNSVQNTSINSFFLEAARKEITRIRKEQAMQLVRSLPDPLPAIDNSSQYIHNLRQTDGEHRAKKLGV